LGTPTGHNTKNFQEEKVCLLIIKAKTKTTFMFSDGFLLEASCSFNLPIARSRLEKKNRERQ
jgi:hypothetical protein